MTQSSDRKAGAVVKVIEVVGSSPNSFSDAVRNAVKGASESVRGITGVEVLNGNADVDDSGNLSLYKVNCKIAFLVEPLRRRQLADPGGFETRALLARRSGLESAKEDRRRAQVGRSIASVEGAGDNIAIAGSCATGAPTSAARAAARSRSPSDQVEAERHRHVVRRQERRSFVLHERGASRAAREHVVRRFRSSPARSARISASATARLSAWMTPLTASFIAAPLPMGPR